MPRQSVPLTAEELEAVRKAEWTIEMLTVTSLPPRMYSDLTAEQKRRLGEMAVDNVASKANINLSLCGRLKEVTVDKIVKTSAFDADSFSGWNGHKDLARKINVCADFAANDTDPKNKYIPDAPTLLVAMVVKDIRMVARTGKDVVTRYMTDNNLWSKIGLPAKVFAETGANITIFKLVDDPSVEGIAFVRGTIPPTIRSSMMPEFQSQLIIDLADADPADEEERRTNNPVRRIQVQQTQTRQEALEAGSEIISLMGLRGQGGLVDRVKDWLTSQRYMVLPPEMKVKVAGWCEVFWPEFINAVPPDADIDRDTYTYTMEVEEPTLALFSQDVMDAEFADLHRIVDGMTASRQKSAMKQVVTLASVKLRWMNESYRHAVRSVDNFFEDLQTTAKAMSDAAAALTAATVEFDKKTEEQRGMLRQLNEAMDEQRKPTKDQADATAELRDVVASLKRPADAAN